MPCLLSGLFGVYVFFRRLCSVVCGAFGVCLTSLWCFMCNVLQEHHDEVLGSLANYFLAEAAALL